MEIRADALSSSKAYYLLTSLIVPRPIAWVSTVSASGQSNLAPFSYFMGVGSAPPSLALSIADRPEGGPKDTLRNLTDTGSLCVHLVEEAHAEAMNQSSAGYPANVSEIDALGLASVACQHITGVRLADARAAFECRTMDVHRYGNTSLVVAEIVALHCDDALLNARGVADAAKIAPVARLGGAHYAKLGERFVLERPSVPLVSK